MRYESKKTWKTGLENFPSFKNPSFSPLFSPCQPRIMLKSLIFIATLHLINSQVATTCNQTDFLLGTIKFNVNHLKDHRPPVQNYKESASLYGKQDKDNYVFFNLMDYVRATKIDGHTIAANCQPRQVATKVSTNSPSACIPEPNPSTNCLDGKSCWTAIGACDNVTAVLIDSTDSSKGVRLIYGGGDDPVSWSHKVYRLETFKFPNTYNLRSYFTPLPCRPRSLQ